MAKLSDRRVSLTDGLFFVAVVIAAAVLHARMGPWDGATGFTSDTAIPVLMANSHGFDLSHLFYLGQDRFGAWPFLILQALHDLTSVTITPRLFFWAQVAWLIAPALFIRSAWQGRGTIVAAAYLALLFCSGAAITYLFELSSIPGWQLPGLFWFWWAWRRGRPAVAFLPAVLAIWTTPTSGPFLLAMVAAEALHAAPEQRLRPAIFGGILVGGAVLAGKGLVALRNLSPYPPNPTDFSLSFGDLSRLHEMLARLSEWPLACGALSALILLRLARGLRLLPQRNVALIQPNNAFADVCLLIALGNLALLFVSNYAAKSDYAIRYFTPTLVFAVVGAAGAVVQALPDRLMSPRSAERLAVGLILLLAAWRGAVRCGLPAAADRYRALAATAADLATKYPASFLLGDYWGAYIMEGIDPSVDGVTSVINEGKGWNRTLTTVARFDRSNEVLVSHNHNLTTIDGGSPKWSRAAGDPADPVAFISQYGRLFRFDRPAFPASDPAHRQFSVYRDVSAAWRTVYSRWNDPTGDYKRNFCASGARFPLGTTASGTLLIFLKSGHDATDKDQVEAGLRLALAAEATGEGVSANAARHLDMIELHYSLPKPASLVLAVEPSGSRTTCGIRHIALAADQLPAETRTH